MAQIQVLVDNVSADVRGVYGRMLQGADGAWLRFTETLGAGATYSRLTLANAVHCLYDGYLPPLERLAADGVREAFAQGVQDSGAIGAGPVPEHLLQEAQAWPMTAVARDMRALQSRGSHTLLRYSVVARTMPAPFAKQAVLGELPSQARDAFVQLDRAGRKRNSLDYVDTGVRKTLIDAYAQGFTEALAASGRNEFQAVRADGQVVNLDLIDSWPAWQAENMHPNTQWSLRRMELPT